MKRLGQAAAFAIPIAYAAGLWLTVIYAAAGENDGWSAMNWLRDATVALPVVLVAVWAALRLADAMVANGDVAGRLAGAVTATVVAVLGGAALALGMGVAEELFGGMSTSLPLPLHVLRDTLLALFATVPIAAIVLALRQAQRDEQAAYEERARRTSRAAFLKAGAGGLITVAGGTAALRAVSTSPATAGTGTVKVSLLINEGYVKMTDGSPAFMRGFGIDGATGAPMVPGPALGPLASSVPIGEVPFVLEGQTVEVTAKNTLKDDRTFFIDGVVGPVPLPAGQTTTFTFNTPGSPVDAGTYLYMDADPVQRVLGLHGALIVMPADGTRRPYVNRVGGPRLVPAPRFEQQFMWVMHEVDPVWGEQQRTGRTIDITTFLPRFFTINGVSGEQSVESQRNLFKRFVVADEDQGQGHGTLVRLANAGLATHSPHFHGNHVYVLTQDHDVPLIGGVPAIAADGRTLALEKDVFALESLAIKDVLLPFHTPYDQFPLYDPANSPNYRYPMHCHAEMSQTAGGGQYPSGMYTEWELSGPLGPPKPIGG
jgi:hypothetical protein